MRSRHTGNGTRRRAMGDAGSPVVSVAEHLKPDALRAFPRASAQLGMEITISQRQWAADHQRMEKTNVPCGGPRSIRGGVEVESSAAPADARGTRAHGAVAGAPLLTDRPTRPGGGLGADAGVDRATAREGHIIALTRARRRHAFERRSPPRPRTGSCSSRLGTVRIAPSPVPGKRRAGGQVPVKHVRRAARTPTRGDVLRPRPRLPPTMVRRWSSGPGLLRGVAPIAPLSIAGSGRVASPPTRHVPSRSRRALVFADASRERCPSSRRSRLLTVGRDGDRRSDPTRSGGG